MKRFLNSRKAKSEQYECITFEYNLVHIEIRKRLTVFIPTTTPARKRLLKHLLKRRKDTGGSICHNCSIGNLSDTVNKLNKALLKTGVQIINYAPASPIHNKFGEETRVHYWELVLVDD